MIHLQGNVEQCRTTFFTYYTSEKQKFGGKNHILPWIWVNCYVYPYLCQNKAQNSEKLNGIRKCVDKMNAILGKCRKLIKINYTKIGKCRMLTENIHPCGLNY